jgi:hypothetical protein
MLPAVTPRPLYDGKKRRGLCGEGGRNPSKRGRALPTLPHTEYVSPELGASSERHIYCEACKAGAL